MEHYTLITVLAVLCLALCLIVIGLIRRLADESAWKAAFSSRLVEIAFRETITADAYGAEPDRAQAPPDPNPPPPPADVVSLDEAERRTAAGHCAPTATCEGRES